jgi:hypothetical protein
MLAAIGALLAGPALARDNQRSPQLRHGAGGSTAASELVLSPVAASAAVSLGVVVSHPASVVPVSVLSFSASKLTVSDDMVTTRRAPGLSPEKEMDQ